MKLANLILLVVVGSLLCVGNSTAFADSRSQLELVRYMAPRTFKCFLSRERVLVREWLETLPGSSDEIAVIKRGQIGIDQCFGINSDGSRFFSSYDHVRIRAGLVRAILQTQRDKIPEQAPSESTASNRHFNNDQLPNRALVAHQVSICLVKKNWSSARNMILAVDPKAEMRENFSRKAAEREVAAVDLELAKVIATLPSCVPERIKFTLARSELRNLVEEASLHAIGMDTLIKVSGARHWESFAISRRSI